MTLLLAIWGLSAVVGCLGGSFLPRVRVRSRSRCRGNPAGGRFSVGLAGPQERTFRGIFNTGWFSHEAVGFLAIPWIFCLVLAVAGVIAGR